MGAHIVIKKLLTVIVVSVLWAGSVWAESDRAVSFSGYGEMHYNHPSNGTAELDFHRLVLGFSAGLAKDISLHAELDFEHAFTEPELEFAYLDFFHREALSFRTGVVLVPVGPLNEYHEPPLFYSVERPYVERLVIPTTWMEPGAGIYGSAADGTLSYRAYVVGGLDASSFRGRDGIRAGRQKGAEAKAEDVAAVGRLEYSPALGTRFGVSGYVGAAGQDNESIGDAVVSIAEADMQAAFGPVELRATGVAVFIGDADSISVYTGGVVGERIVGFNAELALHVLQMFEGGGRKDLVVFARGESINTHDRVPDDFDADPAFDRQVLTFGVSFLPVPNVALKADVELWEADDGTDWEQVNLGVGFMY